MAYCVAVDGTKLKDALVRELILNADFETAYFIVCKFITKRKIRDLHTKLIKHISRNKFTVDLAPRGFGKSTIGDVDFCIVKILREPNIRIAIGSKTQQQAEAFVKEVRAHFDGNEDLIRLFGQMQGNLWTDKQFTVSTRTKILKEATLTAFGASGAVVSKHFDVLMPDDIVGFENARTETLRTKTKEWFYSSFLPTLEPHGELHALGTRYHPLDLYQGLIDSGNYSVQIQKAIRFRGMKKECSLWEDYFSLNKLKQIEQEAGKIIFAMQYQN
jgi:hypothetical protein